MIDDFEVVLPPANEDIEDRYRAAAARDPRDDDEWRSDFRSYLDDPA